MRIKLSFLFLLLFSTLAFAQGGGGSVLPQGAITPGNCTKFGTSKYFVADAGAPCASGTGTVSSVGLALPVSVFSISGSPITTSGTLTGSFQTQTANTLFAGPTTGAAATPTFRALVAADVPSSILPGTFSGFANPTASVGLSTVNGSATTAMRSDAAPVLSQAIAPTWTAQHIFAPSTANTNPITLTMGSLTSDTKGINLTGTFNNAGVSFTGAVLFANYTDTASNAASLFIDLQLAGASQFSIRKDGLLIANQGITTNGSVIAGGGGSLAFSGRGQWQAVSNGNYKLSNNGTTGITSIAFGGSSNLSTLSFPSNSIFQFGAVDSATPVAQTLQFQNGSGTNIAAVNATVIAPLSTGTGTNGDLIFQTGVKVASGTGAATKTTALTIKGETQQSIFADGAVSAPSIAFASATTTGFYRSGSSVRVSSGGNAVTEYGYFGAPYIAVPDAGYFSWGVLGTSVDTTINRASNGVLQIGTTSTNALGSLQLANVTLSSVLKLGNAYVATPQVSTGYVTIQDSTGTTYKVLVAP